MLNTTELHKISYGMQDYHIENYFPQKKYIFEGELIETVKYTINPEHDITIPTKIKLTDLYSRDDNGCKRAYSRNYGFANIQLLDKYCDMVEKIHIEIGGMRINRILPYINGSTRVFEFADTNMILPALYEFEIEICVYFKQVGTVELSVDKMRITNKNKYNDMVEVMIKQTQYTEEEISEDKNTIKLYFNHPVKKVTVISENDIEYNSMLCFDISENKKFKYNASSFEKKCIFEFEETINFSRLNTAYLIINTIQPTKIHVFADTLHIMNILYGMIGMAFSK